MFRSLISFYEAAKALPKAYNTHFRRVCSTSSNYFTDFPDVDIPCEIDPLNHLDSFPYRIEAWPNSAEANSPYNNGDGF